MAITNLTIKQFNELVKYLKRLDDIGDDFYLVGDMILPSVRTPKNRPGKHLVRSRIPTLPEYDCVIYGIAKLSETSHALGDVKGKKQSIYIEQTERGIWITVNDLTVRLAGIFDDEDKELVEQTAPNKDKFDDYLAEYNDWVEIPTETLNYIKQGNVLIMEDDRHTTRVRFARGEFKLKGVSRLTQPVDYSVSVHITSPIPDPETIVIGSSGPSNGTLAMHFTSPIIEAIHYYAFSPFY